MTKQDRYLPRVWTDEGYYYPVFSELGITYENPKFEGKYEKMKDLDWVYTWMFGENDLEFKYKLEMPTSLKDKNGNLLYENDIVYDKFDDCYKLIYWDDEGCWSLKWENVCGELLKYGADFELYGNIHENPDLLENKDE